MSRRTALCPEQKEEYMVADLPFFLEKEAKKSTRNHSAGLWPKEKETEKRKA